MHIDVSSGIVEEEKFLMLLCATAAQDLPAMPPTGQELNWDAIAGEAISTLGHHDSCAGSVCERRRASSNGKATVCSSTS